jgi:hypothetical protein
LVSLTLPQRGPQSGICTREFFLLLLLLQRISRIALPCLIRSCKE